MWLAMAETAATLCIAFVSGYIVRELWAEWILKDSLTVRMPPTSLQSDTAPQCTLTSGTDLPWVALGGSLNTNVTDGAYDVSITYLGGQPYVAWTERSQTGNNQVLVKTWNGSGWTALGSGILNRDSITGWAEKPFLIADPGAGKLYLPWTEQQNLQSVGRGRSCFCLWQFRRTIQSGRSYLRLSLDLSCLFQLHLGMAVRRLWICFKDATSRGRHNRVVGSQARYRK
jgi:hypothetical protein